MVPDCSQTKCWRQTGGGMCRDNIKEQALSTCLSVIQISWWFILGGPLLNCKPFGKVTVCVLTWISFEMPSWSFSRGCPGETADNGVPCSGRSSPANGMWRLKSITVPPPLRQLAFMFLPMVLPLYGSEGLGVTLLSFCVQSFANPIDYRGYICNISLNTSPLCIPIRPCSSSVLMTCHLGYCRSPTHSRHFPS